MNRKLIVGVIAGLLGIVVATTVYSSSASFNLSKSMKDNKLNPELKTVVAKVNDSEITKEEYLNQKLFMEESKGGKVDRDQVLTEIARKDKLVAVAKEKGIKVTDAELQAFVESQKQLFSQAATEEQSKFRDMLRGQGLTEAEYWSSPEVTRGYKNGMYIARLREQIREELPLPDEDKHSQQASQLIEERLTQYVGKLDIEILDNELK